MKLTPLGDRIVVKRSEAKEKSKGGILLPDNSKSRPQYGEVLAVGPGRLLKNGQRRPLQVKAGDQIIFTNWAGEEYREEKSGGNILLMREEDVLAVLDK